MSPILFALYINGLAEEINKANIGAKIITRKEDRCGTLMFADDIALIAEDKAGLEKLMEIAFQYSRKWRFTFNYDKSSVVVFMNKPPDQIEYGACVSECSCGYHWRLGKAFVKQVSVYKYLGVELDTRLILSDFRKRLVAKARMNVSKVWSMGMRHGSLSVKASVNLYEALVRSVLEYGAEIGSTRPGDEKEKEQWEEAERVQREMGRRILRCHGKTTNEAVLGELGWWRLSTRRKFMKLKYWIKLCLMDETRLVRKVYKLSREAYTTDRKRNWCMEVHEMLVMYKLGHLWLDENLVKRPPEVNLNEYTIPRLKKYWEGVLHRAMHQVEEERWRRAMCKKPKLRTYRTFKTKLEPESYLFSEKEKVGRGLLTSIRVGTNKLRIETGRWKRPSEKPEERLCIQCDSGEVEDEKHFVLHCARFQTLRDEMFEAIKRKNNVNLAMATVDTQWNTLMGNAERKPGQMSDLLKSYVRKAMRLRKPTH